MLGAFLALIGAATFAWTNAAARRGVVSGSAAQAVIMSVPLGVPVFGLALLLSGHAGILFELPQKSVILFCIVGISHFCVGRLCNYRAIKAIGTNLAGPVMQCNLIVSLAIAIIFLGEKLTVLRIVGIVLILAGPALVTRGGIKQSSAAEAAKAPTAAHPHHFNPRMAEGYGFAALAGLCYGCSPPLVHYAVNGEGLIGSLAGGVIAAAAATVVVGIALLLPQVRQDLRGLNRETSRWFLQSGIIVYISQIFAYMAVAIAPVTIIAPIIGLNNVFRIHFARWINPHHEVFGTEVMVATAISFLGVVVLSLSTETLPLPASWLPFFNWQWP